MSEALGVVAGRDEERPSDLHTYSPERHQIRRSGLHERLELLVEQGHLAVQLVPAKGKAAKDDSRGRHEVDGLTRAHLARAHKQRRERQLTESASKYLGSR